MLLRRIVQPALPAYPRNPNPGEKCGLDLWIVFQNHQFFGSRFRVGPTFRNNSNIGNQVSARDFLSDSNRPGVRLMAFQPMRSCFRSDDVTQRSEHFLRRQAEVTVAIVAGKLRHGMRRFLNQNVMLRRRIGLAFDIGDTFLVSASSPRAT
jgi:hypothetical protein